MEIKKCPSCNYIKPYTDFSKNKNSHDGIQYECKKCKNDKYRAKASKNVIENIVYFNNEVWKDIREYEGKYSISSFGRVMSLRRIEKRADGRCFYYKNKLLSPTLNKKTGYLSVMLGSNSKRMTIHRLVADAFIEKNGKHCVNHIDGNKLNNYYSNLEWVTHSENMYKAYEIGLKMGHKNND